MRCYQDKFDMIVQMSSGHCQYNLRCYQYSFNKTGQVECYKESLISEIYHFDKMLPALF